MPPAISVIIPVHDCLPYLEDTLSSVFHQSLGRAEFEVVAVDDGSTDGSADCLAGWASRWPELRVVTQEASGGAGRPRNVGIDHARGEFVLFLDGDDCLGPEALQRLLETARRTRSDVVLAKLMGVNRRVPTRIFREDAARVDLTSGIYYSLMPFKLVRRSMLVEHGIRFPEHMRVSEDQYFVASCYLAADVISVLGSYDCYYLVRREDRSNTSLERLDYATLVRQAEETVELVLRSTSPGPVQAHLVARHVKVELMRRFMRSFVAASAQEQEDMLAIAQPRAVAWDVEGVRRQLVVPERLLLRGLQARDASWVAETLRWWRAGAQGPALLRGGRWLVAGPGFDGPGAGQDDLYESAPPEDEVYVARAAVVGDRLEIVGHAVLQGVDSEDCRTSVLMRHARTGREVACGVQAIPSPHVNATSRSHGVPQQLAGFHASLTLDEQDLGTGAWALWLTVATTGHRVERRLTPPRDFVRTSWRGTDSSGRPVRLRLGAGRRGFLTVTVRRPDAPPVSAKRGTRAARWARSRLPEA